MRSNSGSRRMVTVEQANEVARDPLLRLVLDRKDLTGSLMAAYDDVGERLGRSPSWVRKVIGRAADVTVGLHDWLNINTLCARLDAASERLEAATTAREEARRAVREAAAISGPIWSGRDPGGPFALAPLIPKLSPSSLPPASIDTVVVPADSARFPG